MIKKDFFITREDGVNLYRTYSDQGFMVRQLETGILYEDPIDVENAPYTYEESDILIKKEDFNYSYETNSDEISAEEFMALVEEIL